MKYIERKEENGRLILALTEGEFPGQLLGEMEEASGMFIKLPSKKVVWKIYVREHPSIHPLLEELENRVGQLLNKEGGNGSK